MQASVVNHSGALPLTHHNSFPPSLPSCPQNYDKAARDQMMKRLRMYNTSRLYKQNRFNLLHEESEGYAKVGREGRGKEGWLDGFCMSFAFAFVPLSFTTALNIGRLFHHCRTSRIRPPSLLPSFPPPLLPSLDPHGPGRTLRRQRCHHCSASSLPHRLL